MSQIFDLLTEGICQSRESSHRHPHGEILAFNIAGGDVVWIRISVNYFGLAANTLSRAVSLFGFRITSVKLLDLSEIQISAEGVPGTFYVHLL